VLKALVWILGGLVAVALLILVSEIVASETGEVVVLTTVGPEGEPVETRLWVVDLDGSQYLRAGEGSGWYGRLVAQPVVTLRRGEDSAFYQAVPSAQARDAVNDLMLQKYGWRDVYIGWLVGGRDDAIPVRLDVRKPAKSEERVQESG